MAMELTCPGCGAHAEVTNPGVISVTCEYCGTTVFWDREKVRDAGVRSTLPEGFTRLYRGARGTLLKKRFNVLGRVRYSFGRGFWDEWFVELADGRTAWLTEDDHELALESPVSGEGVAAFDQYHPGQSFMLGDQWFVVEEVGEATCLGIEGQLPNDVLPGETYPYVDAASPDGRYTLGIEYDASPPTVFRGRWVRPANLQLDDDGGGWS